MNEIPILYIFFNRTTIFSINKTYSGRRNSEWANADRFQVAEDLDEYIATKGLKKDTLYLALDREGELKELESVSEGYEGVVCQQYAEAGEHLQLSIKKIAIVTSKAFRDVQKVYKSVDLEIS